MRKAAGLEYEELGHGEAVLMIHGALICDAMLPLTREAALADSYRLICYRRRGHGGSDPVPDSFNIEQQAQDAVELLANLGIERAHVVGHSGGGVIATQLASAVPELVHSLVVLEPAILPPAVTPVFVEGAAPVLEMYRSGNPSAAVDLWMNMVAENADWRNAISTTVPGGPEQADRDAATFFEVDFPGFLDWSLDSDRGSRIQQPVLYVYGSESTPLVELAKQHFQSFVPQTESAVVHGVDHAMQMQDAKLVASPIADFLSRHPF